MDKKKFSNLLVGLSLLLVLVACDNDLVVPVNEEQVTQVGITNSSEEVSGNLKISFTETVNRTILPELDMVVASYDLSGLGPDGASFSQGAQSTGSLTVEDLINGDWEISVTAKNENGTAIGFGGSSVEVLSNDTVDVSITVKPFSGSGSLALSVSWPSGRLNQAEIQSSLSPVSGVVQNIDFLIGDGEASCTQSNIVSGYHTLILKLLDNGIVEAGTVEIVRIVTGQTTEGSINFENIDSPEGEVHVNIEEDMEDPLNVEINGGEATKFVSESKSLTATVNNYNMGVVFVWYVNGSFVETGSLFSFDTTWGLGHYNINVVAYSCDGTRAGSAGYSIEVIADDDEEVVVAEEDDSDQEVVVAEEDSGEELIAADDEDSGEELIAADDEDSGEEIIVADDEDSGEELIVADDEDSGEEIIAVDDEDSGEELIVADDEDSGEELIAADDEDSGEEIIAAEDEDSGEELIAADDEDSGEELIAAEDEDSGEELIAADDDGSGGDQNRNRNRNRNGNENEDGNGNGNLAEDEEETSGSNFNCNLVYVIN